MPVRRPLVYRLSAALVAVALTAACERSSPPDERLELIGSVAALDGALDACAALADAPLPRRCAELRRAIDSCEAVRAACPGRDCFLSERAECIDPEELGLRGIPANGWLVRGPLADGGTYEIRGSLQSGSLRVEGELAALRASSWLRYAPSEGSEGPGVLAGDGALLHARVHPRGGLLPPRSGQVSMAERLYALRTELFSQAILEGTAELALYLPTAGAELPDIALAVGVRSRAAAEAAVESTLRELQEQWPVVREASIVAGRRGACLGDLRVLPELAPCYLITDTALVVGWNRRSLERALTPAGTRLQGTNVAVIDFDRLAEADRRLAALRPGARPGLSYSFRRGRVSARELADGFRFEIVLEGEPP